MAENIRLKISAEDLASREFKRVADALKKLEGPIGEASFKFQFGLLRMHEAVQKFNAKPMSDKMHSAAKAISGAVSTIKSKLDEIAPHVKSAASKFGQGMKGFHDAVGKLKGALTSMPAMIAGALAGGAFGGLVKQGLEFNSTLETLNTQFTVLTGSATRSAQIMKELVSFAAKTPFQLEEVATSARIMFAYGMQGSEMLRRIGDAAAAADVPMQEVANTFGRIKAGAFGEAFQRLAEMGIATRKMLEGQGLKFDKGGSFVGSADQAMAALARIVDSRYKGMMDKMSQTMKGKISTLRDDIAMTLGLVTGKLFDVMKPRLDRLSNIFARLRSSGVASGLGAMLANAITPVVDKLLNSLQKPEKFFGFFVRMVDKVKLVAGTIYESGKWIWNLMVAFFSWMMAKIQNVGLEAKKMLHSMNPLGLGDGLTDSERAQYTANSAKAEALKLKLDEASAASGGRAFWNATLAAIKATDYGEVVKKLYAAGGSTTSALMAGQSTGGGGLDNSATTQYTMFGMRGVGGASSAPVSQLEPRNYRPDFGGAFTSPTFEPKAPGLFNLGGRQLRESPEHRVGMLSMTGATPDMTLVLAERMDAFREKQKDLFRNFYADLAGLGASLFVDTMSTLILEKHENMKEALNNIWQSMKGNFVKMTLQMGVAWAKNKVGMLLTEKKFQSAKAASEAVGTAAHAANAAVEQGIDATTKKSSLATAASKIWKAYAGLPFIGQVLAAAAIALMLKSVGAFRTGGVVPGGGSGNGDERYARVSGGEGILTKSAVDANGGKAFVDALNSGRLATGGSTNIGLTFNVAGGSENLRRDIEREVVPMLERLVRQRKAVLA